MKKILLSIVILLGLISVVSAIECDSSLSTVPCNITSDLTLNGQQINVSQVVGGRYITMSNATLNGNGSIIIVNNSIDTTFIELSKDVELYNFTYRNIGSYEDSIVLHYTAFQGTPRATILDSLDFSCQNNYCYKEDKENIFTTQMVTITNNVFSSNNSAINLNRATTLIENNTITAKTVLTFTDWLFGLNVNNNIFIPIATSEEAIKNLFPVGSTTVYFDNNIFYEEQHSNRFTYDIDYFLTVNNAVTFEVLNNQFGAPLNFLDTTKTDIKVFIHDNMFNNTFLSNNLSTRVQSLDTRIYDNEFIGQNNFDIRGKNLRLKVNGQETMNYTLYNEQFNSALLYNTVENINVTYNNKNLFYDGTYHLLENDIMFGTNFVNLQLLSSLNNQSIITFSNLNQAGSTYVVYKDGISQVEGSSYDVVSSTIDSLAINASIGANWSIAPLTISAPIIISTSLTPAGSHNTTVQFLFKAKGQDTDTATISYQYRFVKNNQFMTQYTTGQIPSGQETTLSILNSSTTSAGDTWYGRVRAFDGSSYSDWTNTNVVTIINSLPSITSVAITNDAYEDVTLLSSCIATDVDTGQTLTYQYRWYKDGTLLYTSKNLLSAYTQAGQEWIVSCRAYDGFGYSSWQNSTGKTIIDTSNVPVMSSVTMTGLNDDGEGLTGYCKAYDIDGDRLDYNYTFYLNDIENITGQFLNKTQNVTQSVEILPVITVSDEWQFSCYAEDTFDGNTGEVISNIFEIPPVQFVYVIVNIESQSIDIDWTTDATSVLIYVNNTFLTETQLNGYLIENLEPNSLYTITLWPKKGIYYDEPRVFNVTTSQSDNNPPTILSSRISPATLYSNTAATGYCKASDIDTAKIYYVYEWKVNGLIVKNGVTNKYNQNTEVSIGSLLSINYDSFDNISLSCEANDGIFTSDLLVTNASIQNAPPVLDEVFVTQQGAYYNCSYSYSDLENDTILSKQYGWYRNGINVSNSETVPISSFVQNDKIICSLNFSNSYHYINSTSDAFTVGDLQKPVLNIIKVPSTTTTDASNDIIVECSDNIGIATGYPKIRFINPNLLEQLYQLYYTDDIEYVRYHTFPLVGTYTNIEFECRDRNRNIEIELWQNDIVVNAAENVVIVGGGTTTEYIDLGPLTSFILNPFIQTINAIRGKTTIVEFEVQNTGETDISFTSAILRSVESPESYNWLSFEDDKKSVTFDINLVGGLSTDNKYVRYLVSIPDNVEPGSYKAIIEVNGNEVTEQLEINIDVSEGFSFDLLGFLNYELFALPFTETPTGAVTSEGFVVTESVPFKVWHLVAIIIVVLIIIFIYKRVKK